MFPIICLYWQIEAINAYIKRYQLNKGAVYGWLAYYGELVKPHEDSKLRAFPSENRKSLSALQFKEVYARQRFFDRVRHIPDLAKREFYIQQHLEEMSEDAEEALDRAIQASIGKHIYRTAYGFQNVFHFVEFNQLELQHTWRGFTW